MLEIKKAACEMKNEEFMIRMLPFGKVLEILLEVPDCRVYSKFPLCHTFFSPPDHTFFFLFLFAYIFSPLFFCLRLPFSLLCVNLKCKIMSLQINL